MSSNSKKIPKDINFKKKAQFQISTVYALKGLCSKFFMYSKKTLQKSFYHTLFPNI